MPDSLDSWLQHIERIHPKTIEMGLERLKSVADSLGLSPKFHIVTVGGTNGKGSTCAMLESILFHAGYKVGCYTSPHLLNFSERIRINRKQAENEAIVSAFSRVEEARGDVQLTYFEFTTLAAVLLFSQIELDVAILEVGLGGRLDAVNLFDSDCAVITGIDFDHMDYLGSTLDAIGFEKAGILRAGKPGICSDMDPPQSLLDHAQTIGARLQRIGREFGFSRHEHGWDFLGRTARPGLPMPSLQGEFQLSNASAALAALDCLDISVSADAIREGLVDLALPGRFQVLETDPEVILDVAHNPQAARALASNLKRHSPKGRTIAIFGMLADKDIEGVVEEMKNVVDEWLLAKLDVPRGASVERMQEAFSSPLPSFSSVIDAWHHACAICAENDRILIFGSFYTVADFMGSIPLRD
jgi:dihydrofolate synthase/folylpolyglutamate synthase